MKPAHTLSTRQFVTLSLAFNIIATRPYWLSDFGLETVWFWLERSIPGDALMDGINGDTAFASRSGEIAYDIVVFQRD